MMESRKELFRAEKTKKLFAKNRNEQLLILAPRNSSKDEPTSHITIQLHTKENPKVIKKMEAENIENNDLRSDFEKKKFSQPDVPLTKPEPSDCQNEHVNRSMTNQQAILHSKIPQKSKKILQQSRK